MQIVLISSTSKLLLENKVNEYLSDSNNAIKYNFQECSLVDILEEASYVSMFEDMKYLIVKNADFFGKGKLNEKETEVLLNYLDNPYPCTTLIFTTYDAVDKRKNITKKLIEKYQLVELVPPKNYDLISETKKLLSKYQIGEQSIKYIVDACLGNYDLVMNEINKLSLIFQKGDAIKLEEIKQIVASNMNDNIFKFTDAVIKKDLQESIMLLEDFFSLKIDSIQLMNMLVREYRQMYYYKILEKKNYSSKDIMSELKLQDWQLNKIIRTSSNYHLDDLKDYILMLSDMDYKIKSGQQDKNMALYNFLIQIMEY